MADRASSQTGQSLIAQIERWAPYVVLSVLIVGELLAELVPALHGLIDERWALIMLASVLLVIFRISDRYMQTLRAEVESVDFAGAMQHMGEVSGEPVSVSVFANDGSRYYQFLVETDIKIENLRVLLYDTRYESEWDQLVDSGVAKTVKVKRCDVKPTIHYMTVGGSAVMFGLFFREGMKKVSLGKTFVANARAVSSIDLVEAINAHFEREWRLGETES
jgi:hypothetical protein